MQHPNKGEETAEEETKFDDMPRLRPMDEEEATTVNYTHSFFTSFHQLNSRTKNIHCIVLFF